MREAECRTGKDPSLSLKINYYTAKTRFFKMKIPGIRSCFDSEKAPPFFFQGRGGERNAGSRKRKTPDGKIRG